MSGSCWSYSTGRVWREYCAFRRQRRDADDRVRAMHQYRLPAVNATYPPAEIDQPSLSEVEGELIPYAHRDIKPA